MKRGRGAILEPKGLEVRVVGGFDRGRVKGDIDSGRFRGWAGIVVVEEGLEEWLGVLGDATFQSHPPPDDLGGISAGTEFVVLERCC